MVPNAASPEAWRRVLITRAAHGETLTIDELRWLDEQDDKAQRVPRPSQRDMVQAAVLATRTRPARNGR